MLGSNRMQAVYRVLGLAWFAIVTPILLAVGGIAALVYMVVDVLLQFATNGSGLGTSGIPNWLVRLYEYPLDQAEWILLGKGSWTWLP